MSLALKYRPSRFSDVAGQKATAAVLHAMARKHTVPNGLLFFGVHGSGKTTSARVLGMALNCSEPPGPAVSWPCGSCASCLAVASGTSLDVEEVDAASNGSVERIRKIIQRAQYGTAGQWKVVILDEAQNMSPEAFDATLKELEEPHGNTVFVLLTTAVGKIPATIASRCMPFPFTRIPPVTIAARLQQICAAEGLAAEDELLEHIAGHSDGALRDAVMVLDQVSMVGITRLGDWLALAGAQDVAPVLIGAAADGDHPALFSALDGVLGRCADYSAITADLVHCLRDVLVLQVPGAAIAAQGAELTARIELASRLDTGRVVRGMRVLWDLQTRIRVEDRRAGLEMACVMLSEQLAGPRATANGNGNGHKPAADILSLPEFTS